VDARAGVAGDMLLGALLDAGASLDAVRAAVDAVIPGTVQLQLGQVRRAGLRAAKLEVRLVAADQPHRSWADIRARLGDAAMPGPARGHATAVFAALARAEGRVHGVPDDEVEFHEVGAWDSIADVVGVSAALHDLGVAVVTASPVSLGSGTVASAHGRLPLPGPAVLELARGWQVDGAGEGESATPTGMALLTTLAERCEPLPALSVHATGVGAGSRDTPGHANVVRVVLGTPAAPHVAAGDAVVLETNVDDLDPRVWPSVLATLLGAGAWDAWLTPILMKKGRPAHTLTVLAAPDRAGTVRDLVFALVPTLGVREVAVRRTALARTWRLVDVDGHQVRIKLGTEGGVVRTATPEYDDAAAVATATGTAVRVVLERAVAAAHAAGLSPGAAVSD
jgi:uncharacterized protein (TIGR00299 family) protein